MLPKRWLLLDAYRGCTVLPQPVTDLFAVPLLKKAINSAAEQSCIGFFISILLIITILGSYLSITFVKPDLRALCSSYCAAPNPRF